MSHWWRAHDEAIDDAKLLLLPSDRHRWGWFCLMCLASAYGGVLPPIDIVALKLRMSKHKAAEIITVLVGATLLDEIEPGKFAPHNWKARQFKSDVTDPTNAERQQRYRNRKRNGESNGVTTVTHKRPETEAETERKKEDPPDGGSPPSKYAFESGCIRLIKKDFEAWKAAFSHLDLAAELIALTEWAETQKPKWFFAVSGALAKRNREQAIRIQAEKSKGEFKWNGIEGVL